jgi:hypothetical protein
MEITQKNLMLVNVMADRTVGYHDIHRWTNDLG